MAKTVANACGGKRLEHVRGGAITWQQDRCKTLFDRPSFALKPTLAYSRQRVDRERASGESSSSRQAGIGSTLLNLSRLAELRFTSKRYSNSGDYLGILIRH